MRSGPPVATARGARRTTTRPRVGREATTRGARAFRARERGAGARGVSADARGARRDDDSTIVARAGAGATALMGAPGGWWDANVEGANAGGRADAKWTAREAVGRGVVCGRSARV